MYSSIVSQASLGGLTGGAGKGDGIPPGPGAPLATRQLHRPFCGRHEPTTYPVFWLLTLFGLENLQHMEMCWILEWLPHDFHDFVKGNRIFWKGGLRKSHRMFGLKRKKMLKLFWIGLPSYLWLLRKRTPRIKEYSQKKVTIITITTVITIYWHHNTLEQDINNFR